MKISSMICGILYKKRIRHLVPGGAQTWSSEKSEGILRSSEKVQEQSRKMMTRRPSLAEELQMDPTVDIAIDFLHEENELLLAAQNGDFKTIDFLLRWGADVQQKDYLGRNALHFAVQTGNEEIIELLLDHGINPSLKDKVGMSPLSLCLMRNPSLRIAQLLYKHGARLNKRLPNSLDNGLFLQFVMMCGPSEEDEAILHLLVETYGALVDDPGAPGQRQALHFAALSNNTNLIRILLDLGADLYAINHRKETPLDVAYHFRCKEAAEALLEEIERRREDDTEKRLQEIESKRIKDEEWRRQRQLSLSKPKKK